MKAHNTTPSYKKVDQRNRPCDLPGNRLHLCDEAIEARQQFLVGTALN